MMATAQVHKRARHIRRAARIEERLLHVFVLATAIAVVLGRTF
jgi:hypothetical protein